MSIQDDINANSAPSPSSGTAQRLQMLQDQGAGWIDPSLQATLAAAPTSDNFLTAQASAITQTFQRIASVPSQAVNAVGHFFEDPVLQKQPSTGLALQSYFLQRQGWQPIEEGDVAKIQANLAKAGYLDKSEINGVWTPQSEQAYSQATSDHIQKQIHEGGGFSIGGALSAFLPSHVIPALVGAAKAMRHATADAVAAVADLPNELTHAVSGYKQSQYAAQAGAFVENALGGRSSARQHQDEQGWRNTFDDINTVLATLPVARAASISGAAFSEASRMAAAKLAGDEAIHNAAGVPFLRGMFTDLGPEAAQRGPGVIVRSIYTANPEGQPTGLLVSRFFAQNPVLRQMVPPVRAVLGDRGLYYAFRTGLAQPTRLAGVQALNTSVQQGLLAGAGERGLAAVESKIGGRHTAFDDEIYSQHTIGGTLGTALDMASGAFHGPLETPATRAAALAGRHVLVGVNPSHTVGDLVQGVHQAVEAFLRPVNIGWALNRGTGAIGDALSVEGLTERYGESFAHAFLNTKLNQFAAALHAEKHMPADLSRGTQAGQDAWRALTHDAWHDPQKLAQARDEVVANLPELAGRFMRDANNIRRESRDEYRRGLDGLAQVWPHAVALFGDHADELVTPLVRKHVADAQAEHDFAQTIGGQVGPRPATYTSWMRQNKTDHEPGSFGIARRALPGEPAEVETQTERLANDKARRLQTQLDAAGSPVHNAEDLATATPADTRAQAQVRREALRYLSVFGGLDSREMEGMTTPQLLGVIREKAKSMPKDVTLPLDPSPELRAKYNAVWDAGFKPVIGTDIGHMFAPPVIDPLMVKGYDSKWRALAEHMGLSTLPVSIKAAGTIRAALVERALQQAIDKGTIRVPPSITGARLHTFLLDNLQSRAELTGGEAVAYKASRPLHRAQAEWIAGPNASKEDLRAAYRSIEEQIARNTSPLDVPRKQIVAALTRPQSDVLKDLAGEVGDIPFMDEASAKRVADVYQRAAYKEPAWAFGAGKLEDVFRAGFGFLGTNASYKAPVVASIARLPADLLRFRNRYRFTLDPMFSMRRVVKSALKGSIEGAPMTVRPFSHMATAGTLDHDLAVLNRVSPMKDAAGFDAMDRLLYEQDAFGLYNPRHHMALLAGELARQGMDDAGIRAKLDRAFTYGDRTALERTIGTVFYPFSFERTLWRNVGSYVMDHPGQRLLLGAALQAYSALSQHDGIDQWLQDHGPVLREFQKLNAFDHGIGPGQFGGINALYAPAVWNLFAPQKLRPMKEAQLNTLMTVFPLMRELNSMLIGENVNTGVHHGGTVVQQAKIGWWGLTNAIDDAANLAGHSDLFKRHPALTYQAEQNQAYAYRNALITALAPVLDYNYHHRDTARQWAATATGVPASIRGQTVSRSTVDEIVHAKFPDYDPTAAQSLAVAKKTEEARYLGDLANRDPNRAAAYNVFHTAAAKVVPMIQRAEEDPALYGELAKVTGDFRAYAINLAEQDPGFLAYYDRFWVSSFGPIERITP